MTNEPHAGPPASNGATPDRPPRSWRTVLAAKAVTLLKWVTVVAALAAAFWLGGRLGNPAGTAPAADARTDAGDVEYWTCSMHPQIRQPKPGPCPICGMDLVPVEEHGEADESEESGSPGALSEIRLSPTARKLAQLREAPVERRYATAEIRMVGKVEYDETRQRTISSRVPGRLDRLFVDYTGVPVNEGDHLVDLYSPELLSAQQELIQLINALEELPSSASADLRRLREESREAARQKLLLWGLTVEQVREIERRGTASDHLTIYAPIGGIVTEKLLVEGAYVEEGTEIYTIADLSRVWVKLDAYELDLAWLRYGQDVEFIAEAYPGEVFHGTIAFIDPVLNARTRTSKVRVNVPNLDGRLKPGMFVRAVARARFTAGGKVFDAALAGKWICPMHPEVVAEGPDSCTQCGMPLVPAESLGYASTSPSDVEPPLVIPVTAPLITGKRAIVYVAQSDRPGRYEGREVLLGPRAGDVYLVREGLAEGERVVVQGNLYVDSAVQILAKRSMMQPEPGGAPPGHAHGEHTPRPAPTDVSGPLPTDHMGGIARTPRAKLTDASRAALDPLFDAYFAVQSALSHDRFEAAKPPAADLHQALERFSAAELPDAARREWLTLQPNLHKSTAGISSAQTIAAARAAFEGVSNAMMAVARTMGTGTRPRVLVYHCPMAFDNRGAGWLQETKGAANPYLGAAMFTCGVLKESIEVKAKREPGGPDHE